MRARRTTSIVLAAATIAALSGCTFISAQSTLEPYDPSDGFSGTVGDVELRNALLITEDGETANLALNMINTGVKNATVAISWEAADGRHERNAYVRAGGELHYGTGDATLTLSGIDAELGALFPVYFQYGDNEGVELDVPVLDGTLPEYAEYLPTVTE